MPRRIPPNRSRIDTGGRDGTDATWRAIAMSSRISLRTRAAPVICARNARVSNVPTAHFSGRLKPAGGEVMSKAASFTADVYEQVYDVASERTSDEASDPDEPPEGGHRCSPHGNGGSSSPPGGSPPSSSEVAPSPAVPWAEGATPAPTGA